MPPRISLVICTQNRAGILARCLAAAASQTLGAGNYETIVVDNASTDHTPDLCRYWPAIRYLHCHTRGLSAARNTGVAGARAPIVAFIDDDAIAHPTLLDELVRVFDTHPDAGCVGGRIRLCLPPELPRWYNHEYAGYYSAFEPKLDDVQRVTDMADYPFGANVAYRKQAVERAGYFNEQLGRVGANTSGGEELDLEYRIAQLGCGIYVNPRAKVEHVIFPSRLRWSHVAKSAKAAGRNWAYYDIELFQQGIRFRYDLRMWIGALARMAACQNFLLAYTHSLFFQAKLLRKLRYLMPGV